MPRKRKPYMPKGLLDLDLKDDVHDIDLQSLYTILSYMRKSGGTAETKLIESFLKPWGAKSDTYGNYHLAIKKPDGSDSEVLWSAHTDSVHTQDGQQKLFITTTGVLGLADKQPKSNCLGADDGSGVWLLLEMVKANVPGYYIFHRDEETGRKGSQWIVDNMEEDGIKKFKYAIAFDRKGLDSIITKQSSRKCCSQEFVDSLSALFPNLSLKADPTGSYTDTYSYRELIPECTNVSVGYTSAHSSFEVQDIKHLLRLRDSLLHVFDESKLVAKRDPAEKEYHKGWYSGAYGGYEGGGYEGDYHYGTGTGPYGSKLTEEIMLGRLVGSYPYKVGLILADMGYTAESLYDELFVHAKDVKKSQEPLIDNVIAIEGHANSVQEEMEREAVQALANIRKENDIPFEDVDEAMTNEGGPPRRIHEEPVD